MNRAKASEEYRRCLRELDALYHDVTVGDRARAERPSWRQPLKRIRWLDELREMKEQLQEE